MPLTITMGIVDVAFSAARIAGEDTATIRSTPASHQVGGEIGQPLEILVGRANLEPDVTPFHVAQVAQTPPQLGRARRGPTPTRG